jgi:hypothetical protein
MRKLDERSESDDRKEEEIWPNGVYDRVLWWARTGASSAHHAATVRSPWAPALFISRNE